jgi:hypothetical protein
MCLLFWKKTDRFVAVWTNKLAKLRNIQNSKVEYKRTWKVCISIDITPFQSCLLLALLLGSSLVWSRLKHSLGRKQVEILQQTNNRTDKQTNLELEHALISETGISISARLILKQVCYLAADRCAESGERNEFPDQKVGRKIPNLRCTVSSRYSSTLNSPFLISVMHSLTPLLPYPSCFF